jgi:hypothetical protein
VEHLALTASDAHLLAGEQHGTGRPGSGHDAVRKRIRIPLP